MFSMFLVVELYRGVSLLTRIYRSLGCGSGVFFYRVSVTDMRVVVGGGRNLRMGVLSGEFYIGF